MEQIAFLEFLEDGAVPLVRGLLEHDLVVVGVERLAHAFDGGKPFLLQDGEQLRVHQLQAPGHGVVLRRVLQ
ncbi:MAG: hypothetical protein QT04_C0004G0008 [archaeon GW2011_AR11]|nr:MAG: hypothetical protein QT04_C0004G0008 [archaeon GW2011_AR11]